MTMTAITSTLDFWEGLQSCIFPALFEKTSTFNENSHPEDDTAISEFRISD